MRLRVTVEERPASPGYTARREFELGDNHPRVDGGALVFVDVEGNWYGFAPNAWVIAEGVKYE